MKLSYTVGILYNYEMITYSGTSISRNKMLFSCENVDCSIEKLWITRTSCVPNCSGADELIPKLLTYFMY